jgi:adenylate cyclase
MPTSAPEATSGRTRGGQGGRAHVPESRAEALGAGWAPVEEPDLGWAVAAWIVVGGILRVVTDAEEPSTGAERSSAEPEEPGRWERFLFGVRRANRDPKLVEAARRARQRLPGDDRVGDRLSTARGRPTDLAVRRLAELRGGSPGLMGELGLGALQLWQALAESQGRGRGEVEVAVMFTDLAGFSSWALEAGDEQAIGLLREVSEAIEPPIVNHRGEIVKRLGDGLMAAFRDGQSAVAAAFDARERAAPIEVGGYRPRLRTGIHLGRPRKVGGDYLGVDVNIAARLAEAAKPDEILVSDSTLPGLARDGVRARRRRFRAKGTPKDLAAHSVERAA